MERFSSTFLGTFRLACEKRTSTLALLLTTFMLTLARVLLLLLFLFLLRIEYFSGKAKTPVLRQDFLVMENLFYGRDVRRRPPLRTSCPSTQQALPSPSAVWSTRTCVCTPSRTGRCRITLVTFCDARSVKSCTT